MGELLTQEREARSTAMPADSELLARYVQGGDADAFREIVQRHADMVYATCLRVLGDGHAAEDAGQAVFLLLTQKAKSLAHGTVLSGWLYRSAEFVAREARRNQDIRRRHEREAAAMRARSGKAEQQQAALLARTRPQIDELLAGLPQQQRDALVLRYLEGRSEDEAARELGCPAGTLSVRLSRGLASLRERLRGRGVHLSAAALAALLAQSGAQAAPPQFAASVTAACVGTASASVAAASLAAAATKAMFLAKLKLVAMAVAAVLGIGVAIPTVAHFVAAYRAAERAKTPADQTQEAASASAATPGSAAAKPIKVGALPKDLLPECSGLVKSPRHANVFWTHNDSDNPPQVFAVDKTGKLLRTVNIPGAQNVDWEDIAVDAQGRLVIADIGDNARNRQELCLYRLPEPDPGNPNAAVAGVQAFRFRYPEGIGAQDSNALVVHGGYAYVFTSEASRARCVRVPLPETPPAGVVVAEYAGEKDGAVSLRAAALDPTGRRLALLTLTQVVMIELPKPLGELPLPLAFQGPTRRVDVSVGKAEALVWDGDDLLIGTEKEEPPGTGGAELFCIEKAWSVARPE
ncbi:MAG: sigma-70 family RNA polymerase sigma factor [Planctomycetota bacterium]|nr:sigma-70 family RNA polymerase sigma factor [Planctomycetota bacterium]